MERIPKLPTTKQFRDIVKTVCHNHSVEIVNTRTRRELLTGYTVPWHVRTHYNFSPDIKGKIRKIEIQLPHVEDDAVEAKLEAVRNDITVWMKLCGVEPYMFLDTPRWTISRIVAWCLIS